MSLRPFVRPIVVLIVLGGAVTAAYSTRGTWLPLVFPATAAKVDAAPPDEHDHATDEVTLSTQAQQNLKLKADTLAPREYWRKILIPGVITDRPGESDRGVTARVTGVVTAILAKPGDTVKPGATLFELDLASEFLQTTQIELAKSATDLPFAVVERDRVANLVKLGTAAATELTKLQNQVDRLTNLIKSLRRQLLLFGFTQDQVKKAESGSIVTQMTINAPHADTTSTLFELKSLNVRLGEQVMAGQSLCTLADHQRLFVEGWAFKSEAKALSVAAEKQLPIDVEFVDESLGDWPPLEPLTIHHLANQVDPVNRTFPFYLSLENQAHTITHDGKSYFAWRFRPGQRARLRVPVEKLATPGADGKDVDPFVLPAGAVVREGPEAFAFVQAGDVFIRKPVRVLYEDRNEVVVANDGSITKAEIVVKNQAAALNRAVQAAAAGGGEAGHTHEH